jgi:hypothetical protein
MTKQVSFSKYENEILPGFRNKISHAESAEDVKKFFVYTARELFDTIFEGRMAFEYEDIALMPDDLPNYTMSNRLLESEDFNTVWNESDLPQVLARFARPATNRYKHLEKNPEKTESKIRM